MTDPELIAKKLGEIETCVRELRAVWTGGVSGR